MVERTGSELLVYDVQTNAAHHLDRDAAAVWDACDGSRSTAEIAAVAGLSVDAVAGTLGRLADLALVTDTPRHTRGELLRRSLIGAGALAALPVIRSISAPEAAQAASLAPSGAACTTGGECLSGICLPSNVCQ